MSEYQRAVEYLNRKTADQQAEQVAAIVLASFADGYRLATAKAISWLAEKEYEAEAEALQGVLLEGAPK